MKAIIDYLRNDSVIYGYVGDNVYYYERPPEKDVETDLYVVYHLKPISGGILKEYTLEFDVIGADLSNVLAVNKRLIQLFDDYRNNKIIKDDNATIHTSRLITGGGLIRNTETGYYHQIQYFKIKVEGDV